VRYQRLILEAGSNAVTVRFHPRLTVIAGVGRIERESLAAELVGSLAGGRGGAHLEILDDEGRRLAVIRPEGADHDRVLETDTGRDVTAEFTGAGGIIDLLGHYGLTRDVVRRRGRLTAGDVTSASQSDSLVRALAGQDQSQLWASAERVLVADEALRSEAEALGAAPEDAPMVEEIERRHREFEAAQARHEQVRHHGIFIGGACAIGAVPAKFMNVAVALAFLGVASITTVVSIIFRRRMERAAVAERSALAEAGAQSYIGFHLQRVNGLLDGHKNRQRLAEAAEEHRVAVDGWRAIAGDVAVEWAMTMRAEIESAARQRAGEARGRGGVTTREAVEPTDLAQSLVTRLADLRHAGTTGEGLPLILDEPLSGLDAAVKQWVLELVARSAGQPQVVFLTEDPDIAAWARLEAIAGHLSVIEPAPDADLIDQQHEVRV
jgi:hypothetical protein